MTTTRPKTKAQLDALRLPDLQALFSEVTGQATRCPNRAFLIRKVLEAQAPTAAPAASAAKTATAARPAIVPIGTMRIMSPDEPDPPGAAAREPAPAGASAGRRRAPRGAYRTMTVPELRDAYVAIVGRPTESTDRGYLIWKIREAEKGRVPVGPRDGRKAKKAHTDEAMQILPLRASGRQVQALDTAWRSAGLKSRMHFFRAAIRRELKRIGAPEAAELFGQ